MKNIRLLSAQELFESFCKMLKDLSNPIDAIYMKKYHKTNHIFYGVRTPTITEWIKSNTQSANENEIYKLCDLLWNLHCHEAYNAVGKILALKRLKNTRKTWAHIEKYAVEFEAWAMADTFIEAASNVLKKEPLLLDVIEKTWLTNPNFWVRRAALTFTIYTTKKEYSPHRSLSWATSMVDDHQWFIQKAIGWFLRETSKRNLQLTCDFLHQYQNRMKPFAIKVASKYLS